MNNKIKISLWGCIMIMSSFVFISIGVIDFFKYDNILNSILILMFNLYVAGQLLKWGVEEIKFYNGGDK